MPLFITSYDLRDPHRDYSRLYARLSAWGALRILESDWIIKADTTAVALRDDLKSYIDDDDGLFVATLTGEAAWRKLLCSDQVVKEKLTS